MYVITRVLIRIQWSLYALVTALDLVYHTVVADGTPCAASGHTGNPLLTLSYTGDLLIAIPSIRCSLVLDAVVTIGCNEMWSSRS